jgi:hypothetical protein
MTDQEQPTEYFVAMTIKASLQKAVSFTVDIEWCGFLLERDPLICYRVARAQAEDRARAIHGSAYQNCCVIHYHREKVPRD